MTFLDVAMSAGIGVRKRSINETTLLVLDVLIQTLRSCTPCSWY